jgi:hypothetical protein
MSTAIVLLLVVVIVLVEALRRVFRDRRERIAAEATLRAREPGRAERMMAALAQQRGMAMSGVEEPVMEMAVTNGSDEHAA